MAAVATMSEKIAAAAERAKSLGVESSILVPYLDATAGMFDLMYTDPPVVAEPLAAAS